MEDNDGKKRSPSDLEQSARDAERRLFQRLMRTKTLPFVNEPVPSDPPSTTQAAAEKTSRPNWPITSPGLLELKKELLAKGMSDEDADAYLRTL